MTSAELALRLQHTGNAAALEALERHRIETDGTGLKCSCGAKKSVAELCDENEHRSFAEVVRDHLEEAICRTHVAATSATGPDGRALSSDASPVAAPAE